MLGAIGLDERQESAYRALVALGAAEVSDLAHRLALPRNDTERTLRHLERQGLAAQSSARLGRWVAAPPAVALGALLTRQREELEQAERAAAHLAEAYRAEAAEPAVHDLVEIVTGVGAVAQRFRQLGLGAVAEVCVLATGDPVGYGADGGGGAPGVAHRVVVARERLSAPGGVPGLTAALGRADQVRVADRVPTRLVIADRALAMVPLRELGEPSALVVHGSGLLESLLGLFEAVWRDAVPLRLGGASTSTGSGGTEGVVVEEAPTRPDATDLEILSLLLAGMTDARVAKHLDLGLRTVQRRVKGLMELSGVSTRLQLGWHAHANGWLTRTPG
ncbi:helix-turn-helix domain-containing protein [Streptomyces sp. NPDC017979]|uniref:helix-turn-helix domain-containing protein n=1 Tax=Streptomyces sp. NPDC017979 TaxID=3365024 RepID=UPI0037AA80E6